MLRPGSVDGNRRSFGTGDLGEVHLVLRNEVLVLERVVVVQGVVQEAHRVGQRDRLGLAGGDLRVVGRVDVHLLQEIHQTGVARPREVAGRLEAELLDAGDGHPDLVGVGDADRHVVAVPLVEVVNDGAGERRADEGSGVPGGVDVGAGGHERIGGDTSKGEGANDGGTGDGAPTELVGLGGLGGLDVLSVLAAEHEYVVSFVGWACMNVARGTGVASLVCVRHG